eukprot:NODE_3447_length_398_cov_418.114613_g2907_i0.p3 GENE.NODE_3447_length_398_cov_418.114613_g2907_i0~~NODE_3447_length_398_cov_418.114613_g2907_i0.p3  ORF type:complete len:60 (+),score=10.91 NODE_3447_length_398_cov_418.114613_g2907_i0:108-287(+)
MVVPGIVGDDCSANKVLYTEEEAVAPTLRGLADCAPETVSRICKLDNSCSFASQDPAPA